MAHLTVETKAGTTSFWVSRDISGGAISAGDAYFRELAIGRDYRRRGHDLFAAMRGHPLVGTNWPRCRADPLAETAGVAHHLVSIDGPAESLQTQLADV
jgi:hypothetical protein